MARHLNKIPRETLELKTMITEKGIWDKLKMIQRSKAYVRDNIIKGIEPTKNTILLSELQKIEDQLILETNILLALFKSTIEQSTFLTGKLNQKPKQSFVLWQKQGITLLNELEKVNLVNEEYLESLTDVIHNIINEIRQQNK